MIGPDGESCTQACEKNGLVCLESELENHNEEVDTSEEVVELIKKLGGNLTAATCNSNYGTKPTTPIFKSSTNNCFVSSKENKTYGCVDTEPGTDGHKKARICYCVKGNLKIAI